MAMLAIVVSLEGWMASVSSELLMRDNAALTSLMAPNSAALTSLMAPPASFGCVDYAVSATPWQDALAGTAPGIAATSAILAVNAVIYITFASSFVQVLTGRGAWFVRTAPQKLDALFSVEGLISHGSSAFGAKAPLVSRQHLVDLGSGDGTVVRRAIKCGFGRATGYEINPALVLFSWLRSAPGGLPQTPAPCPWALWRAR